MFSCCRFDTQQISVIMRLSSLIRKRDVKWNWSGRHDATHPSLHSQNPTPPTIPATTINPILTAAPPITPVAPPMKLAGAGRHRCRSAHIGQFSDTRRFAAYMSGTGYRRSLLRGLSISVKSACLPKLT